jgi:hypothetical protein
MSERNSLVIDSAERCLGGPRCFCHSEGTRQQSSTGGNVGRPRGLRRRHVGKEQRGTGETLPGSSSGKDRTHKAGWLKVCGAGEGVREAHSTDEGVQDNALEGRSLTLIRLGRR